MTGPDRHDEETLPLSQAKQVDEACNAFETAWRAGERPSIEDFLTGRSDEQQSKLLRELLPLEIELRQEAGERPTAEGFLQRFPGLADLVRAVFAGQGSSESAESLPDTRDLSQRIPSAPSTFIANAGLATKYEILAEVGRGGMGVVYRARHRMLGKQVAIKVLLPGGSAERFLREAKLLAAVSSPHVVAVHDYDILPDGSPMLCMDWVEGQSLFQMMRSCGGRLKEEDAVPLMRNVCEGMRVAAEQGVVHRDLKPSNILIDGAWRARVADFGLARGPEPLAGLSHTGQVMGTPWYMAPEQAEDPRSIDTRADIYSFGATFYHALTGQVPFDGPSAFSIMLKHKTEPLISPRSHRPALSRRTSDLLERCLAKSPSARFQAFADLARQLEPRQSLTLPWDESDDTELSQYLSRYQERREAYLQAGGGEGLIDRYDFPSGRFLLIVRGSIVDQTVDAIVSSCDQYLTMTSGVSKAIRDGAGPAIDGEASRYLAKVRPGRAVVTSGGNLIARYVFHGVTLGRLQGEYIRTSRDLISETMASCFYHADTLCLTSIAFPLLGTGGACFPRDVCLDTMFRFLARVLHRGLTGIVEARIVRYDEPAETGQMHTRARGEVGE